MTVRPTPLKVPKKLQEDPELRDFFKSLTDSIYQLFVNAISLSGVSAVSVTTLSGASTSIDLPSDYDSFLVICSNLDTSVNSSASIRFNSDSGTNYDSHGVYKLEGTSTPVGRDNLASTVLFVSEAIGSSVKGACSFIINNPQEAQHKRVMGLNMVDDGTNNRSGMIGGVWKDTSPITTMQFFPASGGSLAGTCSIYGFKVVE